MNLQQLRLKIDALDYQLLELIAKRLEICKEIAKYKQSSNLPVQDKKREEEIIKNQIKKFKELGFDEKVFIEELFELIMKKSREVQE